jgi:hypothetical protein
MPTVKSNAGKSRTPTTTARATVATAMGGMAASPLLTPPEGPPWHGGGGAAMATGGHNCCMLPVGHGAQTGIGGHGSKSVVVGSVEMVGLGVLARNLLPCLHTPRDLWERSQASRTSRDVAMGASVSVETSASAAGAKVAEVHDNSTESVMLALKLLVCMTD